jgi:tetratricopeptide (TPR) repeat protein
LSERHRIAAAAAARAVSKVGMAADLLGKIRSITVSMILLALTLAALWMGYRETRARVILINPIQSPEPLSKQGYSADVIGNRLASKLLAISTGAQSRMQREIFSTQGAQVDIQIPGSGLQYKSIVRFAKEALGLREPVVNGDLVMSGRRLVMRVWFQVREQEQHLSVEGDADDPESVIATMAEKVMNATNPYLLASYYINQEIRRCARSACDFERPREILQAILGAKRREDYKWALVGMSIIHSLTGNSEAQARLANEALGIDPSFVPAFINLGNALLDLGRHEEAFVQYGRASRAAPADSAPHLYWGLGLLTLGKAQTATEQFEKAAANNPQDATAQIGWGVALARLGRFEEAAQRYIRASELEPDRAEAFRGLADCWVKLRRHKEALHAYQALARMEPQDSSALVGAGLSLWAMNRRLEALTWLERAVALDSSNAEAHFRLGSLWSELADQRRASGPLLASLEYGLIDPERSQACKLLATRLVKLPAVCGN